MRGVTVPVAEGPVDMTSGFRTAARPDHQGADFFPVPRGTSPPVLAFDEGEVTLAQPNNPTAGNWCEIAHPGGLVSTYMHLAEMAAGAGQQVRKGERIGTMGGTGRTSGVHLHFELRRVPERNGGNNAVDPMPHLLNREEENRMKIAISSGHGLHVRGARGILDEVDEARRIASRLAELLPGAAVFRDDESRTQADNLDAIIGWHNSQARDIDVSIHFNASEGTRAEGIGVETLHREGDAGARAMAARISKAVSEASGLILRRGDGAWARSDLGFLNRTERPAVLVEACFVNSETDARLYRENFEAICQAIAAALTGQMHENAAHPNQAPASPAPHRVRAGAFATREGADALRDRLVAIGHAGSFTIRDGDVWRAQAGSFADIANARNLAGALAAQGFGPVAVS